MSAALQVTDWIPCTTPPVREGVYEVMQHNESGPFYAYWDGARFSYRSTSSPDMAFEKRNSGSLYGVPERWRGVRRWVLVREDHRGKPVYLERIQARGRRAGVPHWHFDMAMAMGFDSEDDAHIYGLTHCLISNGAKAVLP